jgi:hypothetical protein
MMRIATGMKSASKSYPETRQSTRSAGREARHQENGYIETFVVNETAQDVGFDKFRVLS